MAQTRYMTLEQLSAALRKRRLKLGLSQTELAEKIGCTQPTISQVEAENNPRIAIDVRSRIVQFLYGESAEIETQERYRITF